MSTQAISLRGAALAVDRRRARSRQKKLGPSALGECRRRAGYIHFQAVPMNPEDGSSLPAISGTWFHKGALEALRAEGGACIEVKLSDGTMRGSVDALWLPADLMRKANPAAKEVHLDLAPDAAVIEDIKTKRDARMVDYVRHRGPTTQQLYQGHKYAAMVRSGSVMPKPKRQQGVADLGPVEVARVRLRFLDRNGDDEYVYEQDYDQDIADEAEAWLHQVVSASKPEDLPRDLDGPGLSVICDNCPFRRNCWGAAYDELEVAPQTQLVENLDDMLAALEAYATWQVAEADAKKAKDKARKMLDDAPNLNYGGFKLSWGGGRISLTAEPKPDVKAMLETFLEAGIAVPYLPLKPSARRISVTRNPAGDA